MAFAKSNVDVGCTTNGDEDTDQAETVEEPSDEGGTETGTGGVVTGDENDIETETESDVKEDEIHGTEEEKDASSDQKETSDSDKQLPSTATSIYNYLNVLRLRECS